MSGQTRDASRLMALAMTGAAAVTAPIVSGKATRDALFLTSLDYTTLPTMLIHVGVSLLWSRSIPARPAVWLLPAGAVGLRGQRRAVPRRVAGAAAAPRRRRRRLPASPARPSSPRGSGWCPPTVRPSPAKRRFGRIAGMGTLGGWWALVAERWATWGAALLPFLALLQFACAVVVRRWRSASSRRRSRCRRCQFDRRGAEAGRGCAWWPGAASPAARVVVVLGARARRSSITCSRRRPPKPSVAATTAALLRHLLRPRHPHVPDADYAHQVPADHSRHGTNGGDAAFRCHGRRCAGPVCDRPVDHHHRARPRDRFPRLAIPLELRDLLHAHAGPREARRQGHHRRGLRSRGRRHRRQSRAHDAAARAGRAGQRDPVPRPAGIGRGHRRRPAAQDRLHPESRESLLHRRRRRLGLRREHRRHRHGGHSPLPRPRGRAPKPSNRPARRASRCRPTCATSSASGRATATRRCRCSSARTG